MSDITFTGGQALILICMIAVLLITAMIQAGVIAQLSLLLDADSLYVEPSAGENDVPAVALRGAPAPQYHQTAGNRLGKKALESAHDLFHVEVNHG